MSIKTILIGLLLSFAVLYPQTGSDIPVSSAEKFNKRGFYSNESATLDGNEIISDYDGNLMFQYSTKLDFNNESSGDFTIIYNANVEHAAFDPDDAGDEQAPTNDGMIINHPEWILGYKGFAVQVLNFETNMYVTTETSSGYNPNGSQAPLLIPGYHYSNYYNIYFPFDIIHILKADGSKLILQNAQSGAKTGMYEAIGLDNKGYGIVEDIGSGLRSLSYYPGDGNRYIFCEEYLKLGDIYMGSSTPYRPKTMYFIAVETFRQEGITFNYIQELSPTVISHGRKIFSYINSDYIEEAIKIDWAYSGSAMIAVTINNNLSYDRLRLYIDNLDVITPLFSIEKVYSKKRILSVSGIEDGLFRRTNISYLEQPKRKYLFGSRIIEYAFRLPVKVDYYTGKSTEYEYYGRLFTGPGTENTAVLLDARDQTIPENISYAFRDCFTNFMIKRKTDYNKFNGVSVKNSLHNYYYNSSGNSLANFRNPYITNIWTEEEIYDGSNMLLQKKKTTYERYKNYSVILNSFDRGYSLKETKVDIMPNEFDDGYVSTLTSYELGTFISGDRGESSYYNGSMEPGEITITKSAGGSYTRTETYNYEYDTLYFPSSTYRTFVKNVQKNNGDGVITETAYKNFLPDLLNYSSSDDMQTMKLTYDSSIIPAPVYDCFFLTGRLASEKVYSGSAVKSHIVNEYYSEPNYLRGKIYRTTLNAHSGRTSSTTYSYYLNGFLKNISTSQGVNVEYVYPGGISSVVAGKLLKTDGTQISGNFLRKGISWKPFKTTVTAGGTAYTYYAAYNQKGKLDFETDINGYYSEYFYDQAGRLTSMSVPGNFKRNVASHSVGIAPLSRNYTKNADNITSPDTTSPYVFYSSYTYTQDPDPLESNITAPESAASAASIQAQNYYSFFNAPVNFSLNSADELSKAALIITITCPNINGGDIKKIKISGINASYSYGAAYTGYGSIEVLFSDLPDGITKSYAINIGPILNKYKTEGKILHGFKIETDYKYVMGNEALTAQKTEISDSYTVNSDEPIIRYSSLFNLYGVPACILNYFTSSSILIEESTGEKFAVPNLKITYDDVNNTIQVQNRLNSDETALKEIVSKFEFDALKQLRKSYVKNDIGTWDSTNVKTYDAFGNVLTEKNGMGIIKKYTYDYLSRPVTVQLGSQPAQKYTYDVGTGTIGEKTYYEKTVFTDEMARTKTSYYDKVGNLVAEQLGTNIPTLFTYNSIYQLQNVKTPAGKYTYYTYDELGYLASKSSPDEGMYKYKYDKYGNLRFKYHWTTHDLTFYVYDSFNRLTATGVKAAFDPDGFDSLNPDIYPNSVIAESSQTNWVVKNQYDAYTRTGNFTDAPNITIADGNFKGRLAATGFRDKASSANFSYKVYDYDALGRVDKLTQKFDTYTTLWSIINKYDNLGNLTSQNVNSKYYSFYTYDAQGRMKQVSSGMMSSQTGNPPDVKYTYNVADQITGAAYYSSTPVSYSYNTSGWLAQVSKTLGGTFRETLGYEANGNIKTQDITNTANSWPNLSFTYIYDDYNRLTNSNCSTNPAYTESFTYNNDGAILTKNRSGLAMSYGYISGTNKIYNLIANGSLKSFTYDAKGNVLNNSYRSVSLSNYDFRNLPLTETGPSASAALYYDDNGSRICKTVGSAKEYYLRDHTGRDVAVYNLATGAIKFANIYGIGLIGRAEDLTSPGIMVRYYYVKDHLGSIRQTIDQSGSIKAAQDYYPYGETLRGYNSGLSNEKYKYNGKERDIETDYDYSISRYSDNKLGMWLQVDPLTEKYPGVSPYNYVMNNPLLYQDLDGMDPWKEMNPLNELQRRWEWMRNTMKSLIWGSTSRTDNNQRKEEKNEKRVENVNNKRKSTLPIQNPTITRSFSLENVELTTNNGYQNRPHYGVDIRAMKGTPVVAIQDGEVILVKGSAKSTESYGLYIQVQHDDNMQSLYGHLSEVQVRMNQKVSLGDTLGLSGNSGNTTGPHLHFGISINGSWVNPTTVISGW